MPQPISSGMRGPRPRGSCEGGATVVGSVAVGATIAASVALRCLASARVVPIMARRFSSARRCSSCTCSRTRAASAGDRRSRRASRTSTTARRSLRSPSRPCVGRWQGRRDRARLLGGGEQVAPVDPDGGRRLLAPALGPLSVGRGCGQWAAARAARPGRCHAWVPCPPAGGQGVGRPAGMGPGVVLAANRSAGVLRAIRYVPPRMRGGHSVCCSQGGRSTEPNACLKRSRARTGTPEITASKRKPVHPIPMKRDEMPEQAPNARPRDYSAAAMAGVTSFITGGAAILARGTLPGAIPLAAASGVAGVTSGILAARAARSQMETHPAADIERGPRLSDASSFNLPRALPLAHMAPAARPSTRGR